MLSYLIARFRPFARNSDGATATEYAILIGLIAVVCLGTLAALGFTTAGLFTSADPTAVP